MHSNRIQLTDYSAPLRGPLPLATDPEGWALEIMKRSIKGKLILQLVSLVLGASLFCAVYGASGFVAASWYPNESSVKDVKCEIERLHSSGVSAGICLHISSLVRTTDSPTDVDNWYRRQGWVDLYFQGNRVGLWQERSFLQLGPVEVDSLRRAFFGAAADSQSTDIHTGTILCIRW